MDFARFRFQLARSDSVRFCSVGGRRTFFIECNINIIYGWVDARSQRVRVLLGDDPAMAIGRG